MKKEIRKVYWDSCCVLGWLGEEEDKQSICEGTLQLEQKGEIDIFVSALTVAEVIKLKNHPPLFREQNQAIQDFFDRSHIHPVPIEVWIAHYARQLLWDYPPLKPKDSLHVATASWLQIPILNTFDDYLLSLDSQIELRESREKLRIVKPEIGADDEFQFEKRPDEKE